MKKESFKVSQALHDFLIYIDNDTCVAPDEVKDFLTCLSSPSPVCSYIHVNSAVQTVIADIVAGVNVLQVPNTWQMMCDELPVIYKMLSSPSVTHVPQPMINLLAELWLKAESTFNVTLPSRSDESLSIDGDDLAYYPNLPKV